MFETVYHGVPIVSIPVFCDHDANAAKAEGDGYAKKLDLRQLNSEKLYEAIQEVIREPSYKTEVRKRQILLRDQKETPLERAIYWTEYVIRHKGAYHLQSPAKDLNFFQYYCLDSLLLVTSMLLTIYGLMSYALRLSFNRLISYVQKRQLKKVFDSSNNLLNLKKLNRTGESKKDL